MLTKYTKLLGMGMVIVLPACSTMKMSYNDHSNSPFAIYDTDHDSMVSGSEFNAFYKKDDAPAVFKKLDVNQDGFLSMAELDQSDLKAAAASADTAAPVTGNDTTAR